MWKWKLRFFVSLSNFVFTYMERIPCGKPYVVPQNCLNWSNYQNKWCHWMILVCLYSFCLPSELILIQTFRNTWNIVICDSIFALKYMFKNWSNLPPYLKPTSRSILFLYIFPYPERMYPFSTSVLKDPGQQWGWSVIKYILGLTMTIWFLSFYFWMTWCSILIHFSISSC